MSDVARTMKFLERKFTRARAELAVYQFVEDVMIHWDEFVHNDSPTASLEFINKFWTTKIGLPNLPAAINYLDECRRQGRIPEERPLTTRLAPWTSKF